MFVSYIITRTSYLPLDDDNIHFVLVAGVVVIVW